MSTTGLPVDEMMCKERRGVTGRLDVNATGRVDGAQTAAARQSARQPTITALRLQTHACNHTNETVLLPLLLLLLF